ncbi:MAG: hypothetical protein GY755_17180 [Chloroflexi bacterium]|nr:hypothetical protein [Chloroflexota bacterium]
MSNHQKKSLFFLTIGVFLISVACATSIPFLGTTPENTEVPTLNPLDLEIMIAEAAGTKVAQTLEAIPTNTATPIPTETPLPSPTVIPPTSTPTEVDYPDTGSALEENDEGVTVYTDYEERYKISTPLEWLALRPGEEEYLAAWTLPEAAEPEVLEILQLIEKQDPNVTRLTLWDLRDGHYSNGFVNRMSLAFDTPFDNSDMFLEEYFAATVIDLPKAIPGLLITSANISETSSGMPVALVASEREISTNTEKTFYLYQKQALFKINERFLVISFASTEPFREQVEQEFDAFVDDIALLD